MMRWAWHVMLALLLILVLFYLFIAASLGGQSAIAKLLVPGLFYGGSLCCLVATGASLLNQPKWVQGAFMLAGLIVIVNISFLMLIEPKIQQHERYKFNHAMQQIYQQYAVTIITCEENYQVTLVNREQWPAEVVLFQLGDYDRPAQRLAAWDRVAATDNCRFVENSYFLGAQREFLNRCQNIAGQTVSDVIQQARMLTCP